MFKTGSSGNPNGRKRGVRNKLTVELKDRIKLFLSDNYRDFVKTYKKLPAEEKIKIYVALLKYGVPAMSHAQIEFDYRSLSDRQLDYLLGRMIDGSIPSVEEIQDLQHTEDAEAEQI